MEQTLTMEPRPAATAVAVSDAAERPHLTIRASKGWVTLNLKELWQFRDLLGSLAGRDLKLRYKQTALGVIWVILGPLMAAGVFSFVFGTVAKMPSGKVPYFVLAFAGLLGWSFFSAILTKTSGCLVANTHLISKIYFPRLILPLSNIGSALVDFGVSLCMMGVLLAINRVAPSPMGLLLFPIWMVILAAIAMGLGLCTASLTVFYRDVQYILPVFTQILMYASPVAYSLAPVPQRAQWVFSLNPLVPPLEAIRASLIGTPFPTAQSLVMSGVAAAVLFFGGLCAFKYMERKFADAI
jgi:lipopolysaccharide transport system permease protein